MSKKREVQVIDNKQKNGMRVQKGDRIVEMSPEVSVQMVNDLITLGTQLVSETGRVTVEYFETQANMYYGKLNAFISNQTLKSEERRMILQQMEKLTDKYVELINTTDDIEKREQLKSTYEFFSDKQSKLYMEALITDSKTRIPKKPKLLSGLRNLFLRNNK